MVKDHTFWLSFKSIYLPAHETKVIIVACQRWDVIQCLNEWLCIEVWQSMYHPTISFGMNPTYIIGDGNFILFLMSHDAFKFSYKLKIWSKKGTTKMKMASN